MAPYGDFDLNDPKTRIPQGVRPLFETWMRDPHICAAPDGNYYLTGTTRPPDSIDGKAGMWSDGIRVWRSPDLLHWQPLGLVWTMDGDGTWQRWYQVPDGEAMRFVAPEDFDADAVAPDVKVRRSLWAPEIHYVRSLGTFVIVASMNYGMGIPYDHDRSPYLFGGIFALRSTSGLAEGPYEATSPGPLTNLIDACLFEDDDASLYLLGLNDHVMRLRPDLSGLADDFPRRRAIVSPDPEATVEYVSLWDVPHAAQRRFDPEMQSEGGYLFKHAGRYHLCLSTAPFPGDAEHGPTYAWKGMFTAETRGPYNVVVASADRPEGPYGERYTALTHGGHGNFFADHAGNWWACAFNPPNNSGVWCDFASCRPAIVPMRWERNRLVVDPGRGTWSPG